MRAILRYKALRTVKLQRDISILACTNISKHLIITFVLPELNYKIRKFLPAESNHDHGTKSSVVLNVSNCLTVTIILKYFYKMN